MQEKGLPWLPNEKWASASSLFISSPILWPPSVCRDKQGSNDGALGWRLLRKRQVFGEITAMLQACWSSSYKVRFLWTLLNIREVPFPWLLELAFQHVLLRFIMGNVFLLTSKWEPMIPETESIPCTWWKLLLSLLIVYYHCPLSLRDPSCLKHFSIGHNTVTLTLEDLRKFWGPSRLLSPSAFHSIAVTLLLSKKKRQRRGRKGQGVSCSLAHLFPGAPPLSVWGKPFLSHTGGCFFMTF